MKSNLILYKNNKDSGIFVKGKFISDKNVHQIIKEISALTGFCRIELTALIYEIKPVIGEMIKSDMHGDDFFDNFDRVNQLFKKLSIHFIVSDRKFLVNSPRGIFKMLDIGDPRPGKIAISASKDKEAAIEGVNLYYQKTLHSRGGRRFGEVMGYPDCCLDFGDYLCNDNNNPNNFGFKNPAVESLKRSKDFSWQLNVFTESLLPHYPCRLDCAESVKYVDDILAILKRIDIHAYKHIVGLLKEPASLYWTCADKILLYGDFHGDNKNSEIKYHKSVPKLDSQEFYQKNDQKFLQNLNKIKRYVESGDRLVMRPEFFTIYKGKKKITETKKTNEYSPILVKPDK